MYVKWVEFEGNHWHHRVVDLDRVVGYDDGRGRGVFSLDKDLEVYTEGGTRFIVPLGKRDKFLKLLHEHIGEPTEL